MKGTAPRAMRGRRLLALAGGICLVAGTAFAGPHIYHPLCTYLVDVLEKRFERAEVQDWKDITGLVVPCGNVRRVVEAMRLAQAHPHLKVVLSGPGPRELNIAETAIGVDPSRITVEDVSLNTYGNGFFTKQLIDPKPGERWLLITSASHMPRAIGSFYRVGFAVAPWPVADNFQDIQNLSYTARHEWLGLLSYWARGRSIALVPGRRHIDQPITTAAQGRP